MSTLFTATCDECGFSSSAKSEALAVTYLGRHRCGRRAELAARAVRAAKARAYEGEKRDCQHKRANHQHGTRQAYVLDRCKCRPCLDANRAAENARSRAKLYGRYDSGRVDAGPAREHLRMLMNHGMGMKTVAKRAGVSNATLGKILYGDRSRNMPPRARCERRVAEAVLAIQPSVDTLADGASIDSTGTRRRVQALVAIGWSQSRIAGMAGWQSGNFWRLMNQDRCTVATARVVRNIYDQCWNAPQTGADRHSKTAATRARRFAAERGWLPPLAWDDDLIDDPGHTPVLGRDGRMSPEEKMDEILMLLHSGCGSAELMARAGYRHLNTLEQFCGRQGRNDVARLVRHIREMETSR